MRYFFFCLLLAILFVDLAFSVEDWDQGYVLLIERNFVYIDMGKSHELKEGDICYVYESVEHHLSPVATLEVLEVYDFSSLTKIEEVESGKTVSFSDLVSVQQVIQTVDGIGPLKQVLPDLAGASDYEQPRQRQSKPFAWTMCSLSGALGIAAYYSDQRADNTYEMYQNAQAKAKADDFKSKTQQLDKQTSLLLGTSIVGFATSVVLFLIQDQETDLTVQTSCLPMKNGVLGQVRFRW